MKLIGITGNTASGKSTISRIIAEHYNLPLISVDEFSKNWINTFPLIIEKLFDKWDIKRHDSIQETLKNELFERDNYYFKTSLETTISDAFWAYISTIRDDSKIYIIEHPLLFELAETRFFNFIIGVEADVHIRVDRMKKRGYSGKTMIERIINQTPLYVNKDNIDFILDNNIPLTKEQIINELQNSSEFKALVP